MKGDNRPRSKKVKKKKVKTERDPQLKTLPPSEVIEDGPKTIGDAPEENEEMDFYT
jgi:hypothetical protein